MNIEEIQREIEELRRMEQQNLARLDLLQNELQALTAQAYPQTGAAQMPENSCPQPGESAISPMPENSRSQPGESAISSMLENSRSQPGESAISPMPGNSRPLSGTSAISPMPPNQSSLTLRGSGKSAAGKVRPDMEKVIGKAWMGIMASVLIFASLIFFAAVLLPMLTDAIKMAIMYVVSIGFLALGLVLLKRKNNVINVAISSCGLGMLYLSMLLSDIYFHVVDDIVLYLFIFVWAVGVAYLSRTKSRVFLIIGQMGIVLSVLLGVSVCAKTDDSMKLFILAVFFVLSAVVYELFNPEQKLLNLSFHTADFMILSAYTVWADEPPYLTMVLLLAVALVEIANCAVSKIKVFAVFDILHVLFAMLVVIAMLKPLDIGDYGYSFVIYAIAASNVAAAHFLFREKMKNPNMIAVSVFNAVFMAKAFADQNTCLYILLVPTVLMILGFVCSAEAYRIESYAALAFVSLTGFWNGGVADSLLEVAFLLAALTAAELMASKMSEADTGGPCAPAPHTAEASTAMASPVQNEWMKIVTFIFLHFSICKAVVICASNLRKTTGLEFSGDIDTAIILALLLITNLTFKFVLNKENDKPLLICTYVSSAFLMITSTEQLYDISSSSVNYYITLLIAAAVFANNTYRFIRSKDTKYQLYGVIKVTFLVVVVLTSLQRASILLSAALLVLSIVWILVGFGLAAKAIRMYGLVITNLSIVKLILLDITYNSVLEKAIGFFVCGLLCFFISFIYNRIDRNVGSC